ncbi:MAG: thiamine pyrophosphate-binding protein [Pirellulales bacterium]
MSHAQSMAHAAATAGAMSLNPTSDQPTIADYLIRRLQDYGIGHVFGIPGDYVLSFYNVLEASPLEIVGCCREDSAGFAADAYARVHGMGAVCVTYCVGGFSLCNSIAGAFAETSPVVVITGSPGLAEREKNPPLHHRVGDFDTQRQVFAKICAATTVLDDPPTAAREIDRVLATAARQKRPVYIEIPRDMVGANPGHLPATPIAPPQSDPDTLSEAADEAKRMISASEKPVIVAGVEIHRYGLQSELLALAERSGIPITTMMLGKSVIRETHPLYAGMYEGHVGSEATSHFVEDSDCVILLGTFRTDIDRFVYGGLLEADKCVLATNDVVQIRHHHYHDVRLDDFIRELTRLGPTPPRRKPPTDVPARQPAPPLQIQPDAPISVSRMITRLNELLDEKSIVIADVGDSMFAATDLVIREQTEFLSSAFYTSMGFSVPAAIGAQTARPDLRPVVIVGDGAFQMTGMELSTAVRRGYNPIVLVLDNRGYGTERLLHPGDHAYNDIQPWNYYQVPALVGGGVGRRVATEGELDAALSEAFADTSQLHLVQVVLPHDEASDVLRRLADNLAPHV